MAPPVDGNDEGTGVVRRDRLFGLAEWYAISDDVKPWPPAEEPHYADQIAEARADLGGEQFVKETIEGEGLSLEDAMKLAGLPER